MARLIDQLELPGGLKKLSRQQLEQVCREIREELIAVTSQTGGHIAPNLGAVELAVALHATLNSPQDKIIWDVGHQAYAHKILTGRLDKISTIRQFGGLSGFPAIWESPHDAFTTGHASTSISAALGLAAARDRLEQKHQVVAVIGDGSLSGGLALEALNNIESLKTKVIIILNDNGMSISPATGAISKYITQVRTSPLYRRVKEATEGVINRIPKIGRSLTRQIDRMVDRTKHLLVDLKMGVIFEEFGLIYLGPIDGHNLPMLMGTISYAKEIDKPVIIHIRTQKGKGFKPAEQDPTKFHGVPAFDPETGEIIKAGQGISFTKAFGKTIVNLAEKEPKLVAVTAAMPDGTGLVDFAKKFPNRFFDVGIAEEHAVTFAAGLARGGLRPVVAIYSTFLQRSLDQVIHDVCLQNLPVIFCLDRAGLVGDDGPTHHGAFDLAYLRMIPNLTVLVPKNAQQLEQMMNTALTINGPVAIRYPRGESPKNHFEISDKTWPIGQGEIAFPADLAPHELAGKKFKVALIGVGPMVYEAVEAAKRLTEKGYPTLVINAGSVKPLPEDLILGAAQAAEHLFTFEEGATAGGWGSAVLEFLAQRGLEKTLSGLIGLPDKFIEHGAGNILREKYQLDAAGIVSRVVKAIT